MLEDRYIGLALAVSGTVAIGTSFIITKKGLNDASHANGKASEGYAYLRNPLWWAGISTFANFAAYAFAPPILVTPLGSLSVLIGAVLASFLLGESLGHLGRVGCGLSLVGSLIIVLHAPEDKEVTSIDEMLEYAEQPGFLLYCLTVAAFSIFMIYVIAPKHGRTNPLVYISICSLVGSVSVMAIKGFGVAVKLTLGGNNQFTRPATYVFGLCIAGCILVQMNYFNKALDTFSTNVVNPMYFVGFSTATLVASIIMFRGFNTASTRDSFSLLAGLTVTFLGVHLLNLSRQPEAPLPQAHSALESGIMNPRLSISGRMSLDGWGVNAVPLTPHSANGSAYGHGRRSSLYRAQSQTLFNTFEHDDELPPSPALHRLQEEQEEDEYDDEEANERTRLRSGGGLGSARGSRSNSPRMARGPGSQDDLQARRSPQYR
ncbi:DUF803-domain-containing protein [Punctularia strigosozonata HHB-11173 SS5]|uniref:DUF803-domain-containing protein n=1 Tax=Punctularia strigosozonata (strain HHB-11173) TaxID=741275 RepID=UPI000441741A|nr:DUF803-domain-containing protein [Punctularia strigosozonata HHB-11173 SS5]EIN09076.1 DUF803-domain-containing protein [Punctularia strigosozonata HHB-11173 SS5]